MKKKAKLPEKEIASSSDILPVYNSARYEIMFTNKVSVSVNACSTVFDFTPNDFDEVEVRGCFRRKKTMNSYGKSLVKKYGIIAEDCKPGLGMKLAFKHVLKDAKEGSIDLLTFAGMRVTPESQSRRDWQQETIDQGVPDDISVQFLVILIPAGINPRVHDRLNYEYLHFIQNTDKELRIYQIINEKMLNTKVLALECLISNPEALSHFKGWGLIVDYAGENKINNSFIKDVIDQWIERKPVRRFTCLYDRELRLLEDDERDAHQSVISRYEEEAIIKKLTDASKEIHTSHSVLEYKASTRIRFVLKKYAECELFISRMNSYTIGIGFLQPPDQDIAEFICRLGYVEL